MDQLGGYGEETWFSLGDRDLALHIARTARVRAGARLTDACLGAQAVARDRGAHPADGRRAGRDRGPRPRTAGSSSRSTSSISARRRTSSSCGFAGRRGGPADARGAGGARGGRGDRRSARPTRSSRSGRSSTCRGCATSIAAARARGVPASRRSPDHRRQGAQGPGRPDARRLGPRGDARSGSRGCTPGSSTCSSSTRWMRTLAPAIEALGLRAVVDRHDHDRRRVAGPAGGDRAGGRGAVGSRCCARRCAPRAALPAPRTAFPSPRAALLPALLSQRALARIPAPFRPARPPSRSPAEPQPANGSPSVRRRPITGAGLSERTSITGRPARSGPAVRRP